MSDSKDFALHITNLAFEKKAFNLQVMDVADLVGYCDYVIVCSGRSDRQVQAIANHIATTLKKERKLLATGVEGESSGQWVLMDYSDVVVHIFNAPVRDFYDIQNLWHDAKQLPIEDPPWENEMREALFERGII